MKYSCLYWGIVVFLSLFLSCKKKIEHIPPGPYLAPHGLLFLLRHNDQRLPDSVLNNLKLSYFKGGSKNYVTDFMRATEEGYNLGIMTTRNIALLSSRSDNTKDYYLEYPDGEIDTLFVDYRELTRLQADTSACYCLFPLYSVKFNGETARPDSSIKVQTVYLFNKP